MYGILQTAMVNHRNSDSIAYDPSDVPPKFQTKNPASLMVFGALASDESVVNPYFIAVGSKIGIKEHQDILKTSLLP